MKFVIAGSRTIDMTASRLQQVLFLLGVYIDPNTDVIIHGGCPTGIDQAADSYAFRFGVQTRIFPAKWNDHGLAAGPIRNRVMAEEGDELVLIWDGKSRGSASMRREMKRLKKPIHEHIVPGKKTKLVRY